MVVENGGRNKTSDDGAIDLNRKSVALSDLHVVGKLEVLREGEGVGAERNEKLKSAPRLSCPDASLRTHVVMTPKDLK